MKKKIPDQLSGPNFMIVPLLYGTGRRLLECRRLCVKDVNFNNKSITVHDGKGKRSLTNQIYESTLVPLKLLMLLKNNPHITRQWGWQYVFPALK